MTRRKDRLCRIVCAIVFPITAVCVFRLHTLPTIVTAMVERGMERTANETLMPLIETTEPSVYTETMLTKATGATESVMAYEDIPPTETTIEAQNMTIEKGGSVGQDFRPIEAEATCKDFLQVETEESDITKPIEIKRFEPKWRYALTEAEIRLVALVAELEDRNAIAEISETILNRTLSPKFPDTIIEVIFQPKQFHVAGLISDDMTPSNEAVQAVLAVFRDGASSVGAAIFFAEKSVNPSKIARNLYLIKMKGTTNFYGQD